jgi:hypothetical protein
MAVSIDQSPLYPILPIGQQIIFSVSDPTIVATKFKVKFVAQVHVSNSGITLSNNNALIGTFKTTPNNAGVGIFDFRPILETFISPDHEPQTDLVTSSDSEYKGTAAQDTMFPLHLVDKFAISKKSIKYFAIRFFVEYADTATDSVIDFTTTDPTDSDQWTMFNGVLQYDDVLRTFNNDYWYDMSHYELNGPSRSFLTEVPTVQYARLEDYGTLPFLNLSAVNQYFPFYAIELIYYSSAGVLMGSDEVAWTAANGGSTSLGPLSNTRLNYFGAFPANLQNWSSTFKSLVTAGTTPASYTVKAIGSGFGEVWTQTYTINLLCPEIKGYEGIRLTWLNKWGTWDYYTFNMKSTRSITTNKVSYTQLGGTWNESTFKIAGYKGGKKNFRVNSTEKVRLNTDFVTEEEGIWFEQLINSSEVYVLESYQTDPSFSALNTYVQPTRVTSSSYIRKTIANDRLMQYTFEIEKSKMKRTQAV